MVPNEPHINVPYKKIDHDSRWLHQAVHGYFLPDGSLRASLGHNIGSPTLSGPEYMIQPLSRKKLVKGMPHTTVSYKYVDHDSRGLYQAVHRDVLPDGSLGLRIYNIGSIAVRRVQSIEYPSEVDNDFLPALFFMTNLTRSNIYIQNLRRGRSCQRHASPPCHARTSTTQSEVASERLHQAVHGYVLHDGSLSLRIYSIGSIAVRRAQSTEDSSQVGNDLLPTCLILYDQPYQVQYI